MSDTDRDRKRRLYDWYGSHPRLYRAVVELDTRSDRKRGIDRLGLQPGDTVVDLGCGPGSNFPLLSRAVGDSGRVIGCDVNPAMVETAIERAERNGWRNVDVMQVDVTEPLPIDACDAAVATLALSTIPDPERVVRHAYEALAPGGRCFVLDAQPFENGLATMLNPLVSRLFRWTSAWDPEASRQIGPALATTFDTIVWEATIPPGLAVLTVVEKAADAEPEHARRRDDSPRQPSGDPSSGLPHS